jgi:hypothetical protein
MWLLWCTMGILKLWLCKFEVDGRVRGRVAGRGWVCDGMKPPPLPRQLDYEFLLDAMQCSTYPLQGAREHLQQQVTLLKPMHDRACYFAAAAEQKFNCMALHGIREDLVQRL